MCKILNCWFWKPKTKKSLSIKQNKAIQNSYVETTDSIIEGDCKYRHIVESPISFPLYFEKTHSLNPDTEYLKRLSGFKYQSKKVKSYPESPRKISPNDKGYLSDQNLQSMSKYNLHSNYSTGVLPKSAPRSSSNHKPRATLGSNEPFPFQVPKDIAPRQSLFYELRYGETNNNSVSIEQSKDEAEKPMEDCNGPNSSGRYFLSQSSTYKQQLHNKNNLESRNDKNNTRGIILHVSPVSVQTNVRESIKLQAGNFVTAPNKSFVRNLQLKPKNKTPLLMTNEGKVLHPLQKDKVRTSFIQSSNEIPNVRVSVVQPIESFQQEEAVPTIRRSFRRSSLRNSSDVYRDLEAEKLNDFTLLTEREVSTPLVESGEDFDVLPFRNSIRNSSVRLSRVSNANSKESNSFLFVKTENEPVVYAVPVIPTRGRSKSILQQSVKSLTSKNQKEEPTIYRKNIRYSMDTDVFSAETRRRSASPASPGFINMERGQPMLVSEVLNPITSLFISDLKNPVPKDPLKKPKEANIWVKPRRYSVQRSSLSKQTSKPITRIQAPAYESPAPITRSVPLQRRLSRKSRYKYQDESSSSDDSIVVYRKKSKQSAPRRSYHQAVYAAQMDDPVLPHPDYNFRNSFYLPEKSKHQIDIDKTSSSNDICGLRLGSDQKIIENLQSPYYVKMVSSAQQTDIEDDSDLICYPSDSILKKSIVSSASGSKLRWRIIIKRGEEK